MFRNIVILTGAGVSAESGIPVFRSETGLWENERIEDVCVPSALVRNPVKVHDFYNKLRREVKEKQPNAAHLAIARLQKEWPAKSGGSASLVTQNIDNMHELAGSPDPIHMHGYLFSMLCTACRRRFPIEGDSHPDDQCPLCGRQKTRPDIVFFEEMPYQMDRIRELLSKCDLFMSIGTSGVVYPAAGFCEIAKAAGALCVEFNLAPSATVSQFDYGLYGKATRTVPAFVDRLLLDGQALREVPA